MRQIFLAYTEFIIEYNKCKTQFYPSFKLISTYIKPFWRYSYFFKNWYSGKIDNWKLKNTSFDCSYWFFYETQIVCNAILNFIFKFQFDWYSRSGNTAIFEKKKNRYSRKENWWSNVKLAKWTKFTWSYRKSCKEVPM